MDKEQFKSIVHPIMKANGFRRKGNSWYKTTAECIVVFNLQHSLYGKMFYVNLAALLRKGGELLFPKEYQCDIRMRFPIMEIEGYSTQMILDLESTIDETLRPMLIENIIRSSMPILQKLESIDGIIELYEEKPELNNIYPFSSILYRKEMNNNIRQTANTWQTD
ncbi:DUF4304 domain-containing protein [Bacteroides cellulosilyticus]|uniref:DUF4304 domain-containing protein n=1 Tax=Bacteroides cellulosilyticus TaxID=246787 RepID=UPI0032EC56A3